MKKLMFSLAVAGLCGAVSADVTSANVVGYQSLDSKKATNPAVGATFAPIGGAMKYKLGDLKVAIKDDDEDYIDPGSEYLQVLNPSGSAVTARYTYVSEAYCYDNYEDEELEEWLGYVGWWKYTDKKLTGIGDDKNRADDVMMDLGIATLAFFSKGHAVQITSNGEVLNDVSSLTSGNATNPFIMNYLPANLTLSKIGVAIVDDDEDYIDPGSEYLQVLNPSGSAVTARYTYVSAAYCYDNYEEDELEEWLGYVGWWKYTDKKLTGIGKPENKADALEVKSGDAFLCFLSKGHDVEFKFPNVLAK